MSEKRETNKNIKSAPRRGIRRPLLPKWLDKHRWVRVSPVFFSGTVITAIGTTIAKSDTITFVGMVIIALGVMAMWAAQANPGLKHFPGPVIFLIGSMLSAVSMTINPSNMLLCIGMIMTGFGTIAMWVVMVEGWSTGAVIVSVLFSGGIITEALGMTVIPSDMMIMAGMIATGLGAFSMWAYETHLNSAEEEKKAKEETVSLRGNSKF
jgi:hypothetical protein